MGVVVQIHARADGVVRAVTLTTSSAQRYIRCPVQRLCSLEIQENSAEAEYILDAGTQEEESGDEEDGETELGEAEPTDPVQREISIPSTSQDSVDVAGR